MTKQFRRGNGEKWELTHELLSGHGEILIYNRSVPKSSSLRQVAEISPGINAAIMPITEYQLHAIHSNGANFSNA
ncbi:hypothetical protein SAMN05216412_103248 [Nitrosospira multiformis]|uniref:Uncharacterized protein n=1 Tax=Nitrosospira multiformis TaxID=1231 RepID=A0A1I0C2K7_9PROT|nr:hypothetical protein SAMN05216412_103248 [Nitrosospira multiformis]